MGDLDNDGDIDLLVTNNRGYVRLLRNRTGNRGAWLGLRLWSPTLKRDVLGTRVEVVLESGSSLWRRAKTDGSYGSAQDPRVHFGLGSATAVQRVRIYWLNGSVTEERDLPLNRWTVVGPKE